MNHAFAILASVALVLSRLEWRGVIGDRCRDRLARVGDAISWLP